MLKEGMVGEYTVEDFENAEFARHPGQPRGRLAMRCGKDWIAMGGASPDDYHGIPGSAGMVSEGWVPVSTSAADNDRRVERLKRQVTEQDITICRRNRQIEELNSRLRAMEKAAVEPMSELRDLWEAAEIPAMRTPIREGDWIILPHNGGYPVRQVDREDMCDQDPWASDVRVLERAPSPWQAIADAMPSNWDEGAREYAARLLHEAGVKMGEK